MNLQVSVSPQGVLSQHALQVISQRALQQGAVSQHALQVVSQHALQQGVGVSRPTPRGEVEESGQGGLQANPQGGVSSSTPGGLYTHTQGGLQAHTQGGVSQHALRQTPLWTATAMGGTHPTGMYSCYLT